MAEGFLKSLDQNLEVYSAGTAPSAHIHPTAIMVMKEIGIDISSGKTKSVDSFTDISFDYVITVCGEAKENCPVFSGKVKKKLHIGFPDPAASKGTEDEIIHIFRKVRDEIKIEFTSFFKKFIVNH